jgi:uncharacterized protein (TIGR03118 family)
MARSISLAFGLALLGSTALAGNLAPNGPASESNGAKFQVTDLVSNQDGARHRDRDLVNAWGIAQSPQGPLWVADNGTDKSTLYDIDTGQKQSLVVDIPGGAPTGIALVPASDSSVANFPINKGGKAGQSIYVFVTETGKIEGWNPNVNPNQAVVAVDNTNKKAVYKGVAISEKDRLLFAADFKNNRVDVYDNAFRKVNSFTDNDLPQRFAPFNVAVLQGDVYVTFAKREKGDIDNVDGRGLGYLDVFGTNGQLKKRLVANGNLNAPWGMAIAPPSFGRLAGALLVGNFGDGRIHAYDASTGDALGALKDSTGKIISIDGLWALAATSNGAITFSAGPHDEKDGLLGSIGPTNQVAQN